MISVPLTAQQRFAASQDLNPGSPETSSETGGNPGEGDTHGSGNQPAPTPPAKDGKPADAKRPESAQLLINVMGGALILEFIHQVFSFILAVLNFDVLKATAKRTVGEESAFSDTLINLTAWGSLTMTTLISLVSSRCWRPWCGFLINSPSTLVQRDACCLSFLCILLSVSSWYL